jgi:3-phytase
MWKSSLVIIASLFLLGCEKSIRFATFNGSLSRERAGYLLFDLTNPNDPQAKAVADVTQHQNPDVLLLTDVDFDNLDRARNLFQQNYLSIPQAGAAELDYPYHYTGPVNTGIASGYDLDHDGKIITTPGTIQYANDAIGFGFFPGQHGMMLLSKYPIDPKEVRTFTRFRWKNMPDAELPTDASGKPWFADDALNIMRLMTTNVWDVPIQINDKTVHVIVNRPTSTVSDDPAHRNIKRNHDEIRFLADYISGDDRIKPSRTYYLDDDTGSHGGLEDWSQPPVRLAANVPFVILGQDNAENARPLMEHPLLKANASKDRPEILLSSHFKITGGSVLTPPPATQPVTGSNLNQRFVYVDVKF